jgi:membrane protein
MDIRTNGRDGYSGLIGSPSARKAANDDSGGVTNMPSAKETAHGLKELVRRAYTNIGKHRVLALAAGVTFYSILAIFPAIAALVGIYGLFADPTTISAHLDSVSDFLPGGVIDVIKDQLTRIASHGRSTLGLAFVIGLGVSLWSANAGLKALFDALNLIHESEEKRGFVKLNVVSLAFTILGIIFAILALAAVIAIPVILNASGLGGATELLVNVGRWPILFLVVALVLALIYRFGPCRPDPQWRWITWGSAFASMAWITLSLLFSWYAANFGSYNATYGSLGAIMGFMVWLWLSTIVVLLGAEIDGEMEHSAARSAPRQTAR